MQQLTEKERQAAQRLASLLSDEVLEVHALAVAEGHRAVVAQLQQRGGLSWALLSLHIVFFLLPLCSLTHQFAMAEHAAAPLHSELQAQPKPHLLAVNPEQDVVGPEHLGLIGGGRHAAQQHTCARGMNGFRDSGQQSPATTPHASPHKPAAPTISQQEHEGKARPKVAPFWWGPMP